MPWANGLGTTYEVLAWPAGTDLDTCDWRVSLADISIDSDFSSLPDIDRILVLIDGTSMTLTIDGAEHVIDMGAQVSFSGESIVSARLTRGPTRDLNVMTRRDRCTAHVIVTDQPTYTATPADDTTLLLTPITGERLLVSPQEETRLLARDFAIIESPVTVAGEGILCLISIQPR